MRQRVGVIGGGAVGLSIAYELLRRGSSVSVIERGGLGRQASWAGAGILSPADRDHSKHPIDRFSGWSNQVHERWARDILCETNVDVGFWQCGGVYLARTAGEAAALAGMTDCWRDEQIEFEELSRNEVRERLGSRLNLQGELVSAVWTPREAQLRNPDFLRGLRGAIEKRGCEIIEHAGTVSFELDERQIKNVITESNRQFQFDIVCVAAGAWTFGLLKTVGASLPIEPVRGQMVLFKLDEPLPSIVNEGSRYLVPRKDGHVLAGSTMEQVGFDSGTTDDEINKLVEFASGIYPVLNHSCQVGQWAGLRPASYDGLPYIGFVPSFSNLMVAAGHLRSGLQTAPATAELVADLLEGKSEHELLPLVNPVRVRT